MRKCRAGCGHRAFVREYQAERARQELAREEATNGYEAEMAQYPPLVTFKTWLVDHAGPDPQDAVSVDWDTFYSTPPEEFCA